MVGSAFCELHTRHELIRVGSADYDLTNLSESRLMFSDHKPDAVIHTAAKVGGIKANMDNLGEFYYNNILINTNVLESARYFGVQKLISLLSTCIYPDQVKYPLTEEQIHEGPPHISNYAYAYAKRMLDVQSRAYRDQYGCNYVTAVCNNLFGENDNYHLNNSHVIPAIIHKIHLASKENKDVVLWGDGSPLREFTYSRDLASILMFLMENYSGKEPINVGNTQEYSIRDIAFKIKQFMNFEGEIIWNKSAPSGQRRKPSCNSKFLDLGWSKEQYSPLEQSLKRSCKWFLDNYPNVRGVR